MKACLKQSCEMILSYLLSQGRGRARRFYPIPWSGVDAWAKKCHEPGSLRQLEALAAGIEKEVKTRLLTIF